MDLLLLLLQVLTGSDVQLNMMVVKEMMQTN